MPACIFFLLAVALCLEIFKSAININFHLYKVYYLQEKKTSNKTRWWILNKILPDFADIYTLNYLDIYLLTIA
jgi:hypothetical protein